MKNIGLACLVVAAALGGGAVGNLMASGAQEEAFDRGMAAGAEYERWFCENPDFAK